MKPRTKRVLGVVWLIGSTVVLLEAALQAYYYLRVGAPLFSRDQPAIYAPDPVAGWRVRPDLAIDYRTNEFRTRIYTNSQGFRVPQTRPEFEKRRDPSRFRILLLGPSFAFGWGVDYEDSFGARLAALLEDAGYAGRPVELINAGVPAIGARQQLRWLAASGVGWAPDLVIQLMYGSPLVTDMSDVNAVDSSGHLVHRNAPAAVRLRHRLKRSAIVFYSWMAVTRVRGALLPSEGARAIEGAGRPLESVGAFDPDDPRVRDSLEFYEELRGTVESAGSRLLVVYFPLSYCVHPGDMVRWAHLGVRDVAAQSAFADAFCRHLSERGVPCVDLTADLLREAAESDERLYYWLDIHWTPRGNLTAARAVARHLTAAGERGRGEN